MYAVSPNGTRSLFAGNGTSKFGGDGGPATAASMFPISLMEDNADLVFIADMHNHRIRCVFLSSNIISTVAGTGLASASALNDNGPATAASLCQPFHVFVTTDGALFIAELVGSRVRKVINGIISTIAGSSTGVGGYNGDDILATSALLSGPRCVVVDPLTRRARLLGGQQDSPHQRSYATHSHHRGQRHGRQWRRQYRGDVVGD